MSRLGLLALLLACVLGLAACGDDKGASGEGYTYARTSNPTVTSFEKRLAALEGTEAAIGAASGMGAILMMIMGLLKSGDHVILSRSMFGSTLNLFGKFLAYAILALGLDLLLGYAGVLSLGHGVFFGLGAYAMGMHLMLEIGAKSVYQSALPDFMVWNQVKTLPLFWWPFYSATLTVVAIVVVWLSIGCPPSPGEGPWVSCAPVTPAEVCGGNVAARRGASPGQLEHAAVGEVLEACDAGEPGAACG